MLGQEGFDGRRLVAADVVADDMDGAPLRLAFDDVTDEADELFAVWREAVLPITSPVAVFNAPNKLSVPLRLYSKPWLSARPGDSMRSLRSSAWIAVFASTQNTAT